jgi:hypothetical protein
VRQFRRQLARVAARHPILECSPRARQV